MHRKMFSVAKLCMATMRREPNKNSRISMSIFGQNHHRGQQHTWNKCIQGATFSSCSYDHQNRSSSFLWIKSPFLHRTTILPRFGIGLLCANKSVCATGRYHQFLIPPAVTYLKASTVSTSGGQNPVAFNTTVRQKSSSNDSKQYYSDKSKSSRQKLYYTLKHYIKTPENAEKFVSHLKEDEKRLLLEALNSSHGTNVDAEEEGTKISRRQLSLVFIHNCIPFVGFGFLDNAIMILAGDFIDHSIGATLGISVMAAAALGNTVSDLFGIGLAGYVELLFYKLGLPVPALTPEQAEQSSAIRASNGGKAIGIVIGCLLGMLPLLFISEREDEEEKEEDSR